MTYGTQVRSFRVGSGSLIAGALSTIHRVPEGYTTLIKDVSVQNFAAAGASCDLLIDVAGLNIVVARVAMASQAVTRLSPWWAIPELGEFTVWNGNVGTIAYYVSGALLPGVVEEGPSARPSRE